MVNGFIIKKMKHKLKYKSAQPIKPYLIGIGPDLGTLLPSLQEV